MLVELLSIEGRRFTIGAWIAAIIGLLATGVPVPELARQGRRPCLRVGPKEIAGEMRTAGDAQLLYAA
jgi:hypothetical protein